MLSAILFRDAYDLVSSLLNFELCLPSRDCYSAFLAVFKLTGTSISQNNNVLPTSCELRFSLYFLVPYRISRGLDEAVWNTCSYTLLGVRLSSGD